MTELSYDTATALLGSQVAITDPASNLKLLAEVTEVNPQALHGDVWESFSIILAHDGEMSLGQSTYEIEHQSFGSQQLFVTPNSEQEAEIIITRKLAS